MNDPCLDGERDDVPVGSVMGLDDVSELEKLIIGDEVFVLVDVHDAHRDMLDEVVGIVWHIAVAHFVEAEDLADVVENGAGDDHVPVYVGPWHDLDKGECDLDGFKRVFAETPGVFMMAADRCRTSVEPRIETAGDEEFEVRISDGRNDLLDLAGIGVEVCRRVDERTFLTGHEVDRSGSDIADGRGRIGEDMKLAVLISSAYAGYFIDAAGLDDSGDFYGFFSVKLRFDEACFVDKSQVGELFAALASKFGTLYQEE